MSAEALLDMFALLKEVSSRKERRLVIGKVLELTNLTEVRKKHVSGYSGGMKQRFGIAQLLLNNPSLIIVDEPTAGLDPGERNRFHNLLVELGEEAVVILSTHIVDDVKELCTKMAIINHGQILMTGNPLEAIDKLRGKVWKKRIEKEEVPQNKLKYNVISDKMIAGKPEIHILSESDPGEGFTTETPTLEDVYFSHIIGSQKPVTA